MIELDWNEWKPFREWKNVSHVPLTRGVYQVRACDEKGVPVQICRSCGEDTDGLLYIGEGQLQNRLGRLQYLGLVDGKAHHHFIATFGYYGLDRICKREDTEIRWAVVDNCKEAERDLIDAYCKKFGDMPPGNLKLGG